MAPSRFTVVAVASATALILGSCGQATDDAVDSALRPPQPVRVAQASGAATAEAALGSDAARSSMPAFLGFTYEAGPGLPSLPTNATGYQYPPGATVDVARVDELAAALGVQGEVVPGGGTEVDGLSWRVGPDDGSAPSLTVGADPQLSVNYSQAWNTGVAIAGCVEPAVAADSTGDVPSEAPCEEPEPPSNVPSADEAEAFAADVLEAIGLDPATFEFETYADDWAASVTAWSELDGVRSPIAWGFGYGGNAELQWMNGALATPVATGPYPLIGLDEALDRLEEQNTWFGGGLVMGDVAVTSDADAPAESAVDPGQPVPVETVPVETVPVETVPTEVVTEVATLTDVRADLWWAWDDDGSVWLLPAYTFTDTEDRPFTVPAVTDEFLVIAEPEPVLVDPVPVEPVPAEPVPADSVPVDSVPVDSVVPDDVPEPDHSYVVGLDVDDATAKLAASGLTLRVVIDNGTVLAVTEDFSSTRVNVEVADGVVIAVVSIG